MKRSFAVALAGTVLAAIVSSSSALAQATPDTLGRIKAAKAINVAFSGDSPPYSSVGADNKPVGYSIDICKKVIAQIGRTTGVGDPKVNWLVGTVSERLQMVASGKADLDCANTTATQTRMETVDFSNLVFVETGGFLVTVTPSIQKVSDLAGKRIGVIGGTTTESRLQAMLKERQQDAMIMRLKDGNEGLAMLESGSLDAFASDKLKLVGLARSSKNPSKLALLQEDLSYEPLAFAVPRGDSAFRLEVNRALTRIYVGGEIEPIFGQWFGDTVRPTGLLAAMYLLNAIPQ